MIIVPFAPGFEEIEAVTIVDILRRVYLEVVTVHLGSNPVEGSHGMQVTADLSIDEINADETDVVVLPGGMPGSVNLREDERVINLLQKVYSAGKPVAAVCAAPIVLAHAGLLEGKKVTVYPGNEDAMGGARLTDSPVEQDGRIITGRGPGCAIPFALKLVEELVDKDTANKLKEGMQVYWM